MKSKFTSKNCKVQKVLSLTFCRQQHALAQSQLIHSPLKHLYPFIVKSAAK